VKIPTQIRYGTRALFYIAYHRGGASTQVKEIAGKESISQRYLEQIFQRFKRSGLVGSHRGPQGGYFLLKRPNEIRIGDIVRAINGSDLYLVFCVDPKKRKGKDCERKSLCPVKDVWRESSEMLMRYLDSITLEDLCRKALEIGIERKVEETLTYQI